MTGSFELPGYGTVRKRTMSKEDLVELWNDIRARTQLHIEEGVRVESIVADGNVWRVDRQRTAGCERAANVVLALGRRGAPNQLGVPGEELSHVAYRLLEPEVYAGKRVLVVGGGNAAARLRDRARRAGPLRGRRDQLPPRRARAGCAADVRNKIDKMVRTGQIKPFLRHRGRRDPADRVTLRGRAATCGCRSTP